MKTDTNPFAEGWHLNEPASRAAISSATATMTIALPGDYLDFILRHDGGEGFLGSNYLVLWRIGELLQFNREYEAQRYAPGLLLFGSNGGGEAYAFDTRNSALPIVMVPFIGMELQYATPIAANFSELVLKLENT